MITGLLSFLFSCLYSILALNEAGSKVFHFIFLSSLDATPPSPRTRRWTLQSPDAYYNLHQRIKKKKFYFRIRSIRFSCSLRNEIGWTKRSNSGRAKVLCRWALTRRNRSITHFTWFYFIITFHFILIFSFFILIYIVFNVCTVSCSSYYLSYLPLRHFPIHPQLCSFPYQFIIYYGTLSHFSLYCYLFS